MGRQNLTPQLTTAQVRALEAMAGGATIAGAATAAGVSRQTVHRWLRDDPSFVAERNCAAAEALEKLRSSVSDLVGDAIVALRDSLRDPKNGRRGFVALKMLEMLGVCPRLLRDADLTSAVDVAEERMGPSMMSRRVG